VIINGKQGAELAPDDVRGLHRREEGERQTKAEVVGPVPLDVGEPLVHLDPWVRRKPLLRHGCGPPLPRHGLRGRGGFGTPPPAPQDGGGGLTFVEPAVLEAVERVEQRHVEEADELADGVDGEEADDHPLREEKEEEEEKRVLGRRSPRGGFLVSPG